MKTWTLAWGLILGVSVGAFTTVHGEILVGDRQFQVVEMLGQPNGCVGSDQFRVCYYDRGEVVFRGGVVESHTIISEAEYQRRQAEATQAREAQVQREREKREARIAEGLAILEERTSDPLFETLPAANRFTFWRVFRQKYPEIDVEVEYSVARQEAQREHAAQVAKAERERRLHELELRVLEAEHQARIAERDAYEAQRRRPTYVYRDSVVYTHPHHRHRKAASPPRYFPGWPPNRSSEKPETTAQQPYDIRDRLHPDAFMFPPLESNF